MQTQVRRNASASRFEVLVGDELAGIADFRDNGQDREFPHTEVFPQFASQGLAKVLIKSALDATREEGLGVLPACTFVSGFIGKNPDYLPLVPESARARYGLATNAG